MDTWQQWIPSAPPEWRLRPPQAAVEAVRRQLLAALDDCRGADCERLRWRLHTAERAQELWLLRGQVLQVVAGEHCLQQAQERSESLLAAFRSVLPSGTVGRT